MKRLIMAVLLAVLGGLAVPLGSTPSQAAAISIPGSDMRAHTAQDLVEQVRRYRHCWWRGGRRHCVWYYTPGYYHGYYPGYRRCHRWHRICRYRWGYSWRYHRCMRNHGC